MDAQVRHVAHSDYDVGVSSEICRTVSKLPAFFSLVDLVSMYVQALLFLQLH